MTRKRRKILQYLESSSFCSCRFVLLCFFLQVVFDGFEVRRQRIGNLCNRLLARYRRKQKQHAVEQYTRWNSTRRSENCRGAVRVE